MQVRTFSTLCTVFILYYFSDLLLCIWEELDLLAWRLHGFHQLNKEGVRVGCRKFCDEELCDFSSLPNIIRVISLRRMV
jgi:hypothetical protein